MAWGKKKIERERERARKEGKKSEEGKKEEGCHAQLSPL